MQVRSRSPSRERTSRPGGRRTPQVVFEDRRQRYISREREREPVREERQRERERVLFNEPRVSTAFYEDDYGSYDPYHFQKPPAQNNKIIQPEPRRYEPPPPPPRVSSSRLPYFEREEIYASDSGDDIEMDPSSRYIRRRPSSYSRRSLSYKTSLQRQPAVRMNPKEPKDVTVHMSLDAAPDLEGFLEENARFRRLGHFDAALSHFDETLAPSLDNMYVRVQYAHCLYDARQYRKLAELAKKYPLAEEDSFDNALFLNWTLLLRKAETFSEFDFHDTIEEEQLITQALNGFNYNRLDSTDLQILTLVVCMSPEDKVKDIAWYRVLDTLTSQHRIWDFRDVYLALEEKFGFKEARDVLYGPPLGGSPVDSIIADWSEVDDDETMLFGTLDLFASLAFACMKTKGNIKDAKKCLQAAERLATLLLERDVANLKTRPCLMWIMAGVFFEEYSMNRLEGNNISFTGPFRGEYRVSTRIFPNDELPLYAPHEDEIPSWSPKASGISYEAKKTTRVVLKAAEEIGDLPVQVGCLQQLLDQGSDNPSREIKRINELWMSAGNMASYLRLQLFRFMLVKTETDKRNVRRAILEHGESLSGGFTEYCRCMILRALSSKTWEKELYLDRANDTFPDDAEDEEGEDDQIIKYPKHSKGEIVTRDVARKGGLKRRETQYEEEKKKVEEEKKKKLELEERERREAEKDVQIKKLKEELEALKRERPALAPPAQITWDEWAPPKEKKKKKKERVGGGDITRDAVDTGLSGVGAADEVEIEGATRVSRRTEAERNEGTGTGDGPTVEFVD